MRSPRDSPELAELRTRLWFAEARRAKSQPWPNGTRPEKKKKAQLPSGSPEGDMAVSCALEGPDMGLAAPHCHPAPPEAQGNSWGCLGPAVAMLVAIQRPKRAKSVPRPKGPQLCKSTLGGSRGMKPPQPMAQITQRDPWGVCELHRTTGRTSNKPHNPIVKTPSRKSGLITRAPYFYL